MDKWTQLTRQPEYLHLVLNHLPIVGLATALLFLLAALCLRQRGSILFALIVCTVFAASGIAVLQSGEAAFNRVLGSMPHDAPADDFLKAHAEQARGFATNFYAATAICALVTVAGFFSTTALRWGAPLALVAGALCVWCALQAAESGGQIKHRELRVHGPPR